MPILLFVETVWAAAVPLISEVARLVLGARADGGAVLSVLNTAAEKQAVAGLAAGSFGFASPGSLTTETLLLDGASHRISTASLAMKGSTTIWLDASASYNASVAACRDGNLLFLSARNGSGVTSYQLDAGNRPSPLASCVDTPALALEGVSALTSLRTAGGHYLIAASATQHALTVLRVGAGGGMTAVARIGAAELLPVNVPSQIGSVTVEGQNFVIVGSFGTGSLTVLRLGDTGTLSYVDQVLDSRDTRFAGLTAMDILTLGNQALVAAAGNDGGLSLFQMLPTGRLILRDTLIDGAATALQNIQDLRFVIVGDQIELFALASADAGVTRIRLNPAQYAVTSGIMAASAGADLLTAGQGGWIKGGAGDDILVAGPGVDTLEGGAGADLYVPMPDAAGRDVILGFDPTADRIDLSGFAFLHDASGLTIRPTASGAVIGIGATTLTVNAGYSLTASALQAALLFNTDRLLTPVVPPLSTAINDPAANDTFYWRAGARVYDGGGGSDRVSYAAAPMGVVIYLDTQTRNAGAALGHDLRSIEIIEGSAFVDHLQGSDRAETFIGGAGNDVLEGGGGNDWITPGAGNDIVDGGAGVDMASFVDAPTGMVIDLAAGSARGDGEADRLIGIENITGSIFGDAITGDAGDNLLRGLGDYDWFVGSAGADTIDGGNGRDIISYINSAVGVTVDLGAGKGSGGLAAGDSYISVERATGSSHDDRFFGSTGDDDFRGMYGADWFEGSAGRDRYDGGGGPDTVSYSRAISGVTASLLLGRGSAGLASRDLYTAIENLSGSRHADVLTGDNGANHLWGMAGDDLIFANGGRDSLEGGAGNDLLDGGAGWDTAFYSGKRSDYLITGDARSADVRDLRTAGDGSDHLIGIEVLVFSDSSHFL